MINELEPTSAPEQSVEQSPPKKTFILQKGMRVSIGNYLYKITASRPNGKITMRAIRKLDNENT
jgi:hypothetical protein